MAKLLLEKQLARMPGCQALYLLCVFLDLNRWNRLMTDSSDSSPSCENEIRVAEACLRSAMLTSDVQQLDQLIDNRLLFVGPDSRVYSKQDDLSLHRSGAQRVEKLEIEELLIETHGEFGVSTVLAQMSGTFNDEPFGGRFRYIRTWAKTPTGWRIVAGSVCAAAGSSIE
jgi:hypothetical protein